MRRERTFFRGAEFSRWLVLTALMIAGWTWYLFQAQPPPEPREPPATAATNPDLPPPDDAPELQGLQDKYKITARDTPAYQLLFRKVRETPFEELRRDSRRDVRFAQLLDNPQRYRGLPVHFEGIVHRVVVQENPESRVVASGKSFEAYAVSPDSIKYPWVLCFEQAPPELAIGDDLAQPIVFDGYFLKLWAYQAGDDKVRVAPVLIGRFPPAPVAPAARPPAPARPSRFPWWPIVLGLLTTYIGIRFVMQLRGAFARPARGVASRTVVDSIEPEALDAWIESASSDEPDEEADADEPWRAGPP